MFKPVEIPEIPEPVKPVAAPPKVKQPRVQREMQEVDPDTMHHTIMRCAFQHAARSAHEVRVQNGNKYDALLSRMVK